MADTLLESKPMRGYRDYAQPLIRRLLVNREAAIIGLLVLVYLVAALTVRNFAAPITITYLLLDVATILLIALPMTLIIPAGPAAA